MTELTVSQRVAVPAALAWLAATDWERQGEWLLGTQVRVVAGDGASVGSRVLAVTGAGPLGIPDLMEISEWDPPGRCVVRHLGPVVRGAGIFAVVPLGPDRAVFSWTERLEEPLGTLGRAVWPLVRPVLAAGLRVSLRRFARFAVSYPRRLR